MSTSKGDKFYIHIRLNFVFNSDTGKKESERISSEVHLAYEFPSAVHTQVIIGFLPSDSHLAAEGVCLHYELGL